MNTSITPHPLPSFLLAWLRLMLLGLLGLCLGWFLPSWAQSDDEENAVATSGFYLLADKSYGSHEQAQVRLELQDVQAAHAYGGVDIRVYQVPQPLNFLQNQRNLHRINLKAAASPTGVWPSIVALWDNIMQSARLLWRRVFSEQAREAVTQTNPSLSKKPDLFKRHPIPETTAYQKLAGFQAISQFRYPIHLARDIPKPKTTMEGANLGETSFQNNPDETVSEADQPNELRLSNGKAMLPVGQLAPGLYVIEAMIGKQRAVTLMFISDNLLMTKSSANNLLIWTAHRLQGTPAPETQAVWTDGQGLLGKGITNGEGWLRLNHSAPEQTYVFAQDTKGGVLISENFYYDSEIYNTKLYATTDHALYRPGDTVHMKVVGREFINARQSKPLIDGSLDVVILDATGQPVAKTQTQISGQTGANASLALPSNAVPGGYEIQMTYQNEVYGAAFRVADFQKPHFEMHWQVESKHLKTQQEIPAKLELRYPDGKPVQNAQVEITVKAQNLSITQGDLDYGGLYPVKLTSESYRSDNQGVVTLKLPASQEPSRYVLSALATDGAAFRVRHSQELLIERAASTWRIQSPQRFSEPDQAVTFNIERLEGNDPPPTRYQWIRLEDRKTETGSIQGTSFSLKLNQSGSYSIQLLSENNSILGATSHWVSGTDLKVAPGNIDVIWNKPTYQIGDTAVALVSFPEPVEHALVTLERDTVEQISLLQKPSAWLKTQRLNPKQWHVTLPITETLAPNITFSVAYMLNEQFVFANAGILIASDQIQVNVQADKPHYAPGDTATLNLRTHIKGQGTPAQVSLAVVDEMLYVLQPEIAPNIHDFFYHPRRNNVRTHISQSFIGYDLSTDQLGQTPRKQSVQERAVKVLERPKRDEVDTALWAPNLQTDAQGNASVRFKIPDSLTRWRITARAMNAQGLVGQSVHHVRSHKDVYAKWTSPRWLRSKDQATSNLALFNETSSSQKVQLTLSGAITHQQTLTLKPGVTYVDVPRQGTQTGTLNLQIHLNDQLIDQMNVTLNQQPDAWIYSHRQWLQGDGNTTALKLPEDARNISMRWLPTQKAGFEHIMDDLVDQPYGCIEQTASRLIPLALAAQSMGRTDPRFQAIQRDLFTQRQRLISMAGPEAQFGWWGSNMTPDPFITFYAYYADWYASKALQINLPTEHWQSLLELYRKSSDKMPPLQRALALDWMRQMGLPIGNLTTGLAQHLMHASPDGSPAFGPRDSWLFGNNSQSLDMAMVLTSHLLKGTGKTEGLSVAASSARLAASSQPQARALLVYTGQQASSPIPILNDMIQIGSAYATMDRAVALTWFNVPITASAAGTSPLKLASPWVATASPRSGEVRWVWPSAQILAQKRPTSALLPSDGIAWLQYESSDIPKGQTMAPGRLQRALYRLESRSDGNFNRTLVNPNDGLRTDTLYLEELILESTQLKQFVLIEAPLPPGASVEASTWGIRLGSGEGATSLPEAQFQAFTGHYAVPVAKMVPVAKIDKNRVVLTHLIRFAQRGQYQIPPARAYDMYRPDRVVTSGVGSSWQIQ